jgi:hypothetical protein
MSSGVTQSSPTTHPPVVSQIAHYKTAHLLLPDHGQYTSTINMPPRKVEIARKPVSRPALNTRSKSSMTTTPSPLTHPEAARAPAPVSEHPIFMKRQRIDFQLVPLILEKEDDHQDHSGLSSDNDNLPYEHDDSIHDDPVSEQTSSVQDSRQAPDLWVKNHVQHGVMPQPPPNVAFQTVKQFIGTAQVTTVRQVELTHDVANACRT